MPKPDAIILKTSEGKSYSEVFKNLKKNSSNNLNGIQTARKSRGGDVILEMEKNVDPSKVEMTIKKSLGLEQIIRKVSLRALLEVKNIDPTTCEEDLIEIASNKLEILVSNYISPNMDNTEYLKYLDNITIFIKTEKGRNSRIIAGGDFNAKSTEWGSRERDHRGEEWLKSFWNLDMAPIKLTDGSTFSKGKKTSNIDFVVVPNSSYHQTTSPVLDQETGSDHKYILSIIKIKKTEH